VGVNAEQFLWDTWMDECLQLIHADGIHRGANYQWANYFAPEQALLDEMQKLETIPLDEPC
jgi:hypothetical protein